jgi:hypothetical protein
LLPLPARTWHRAYNYTSNDCGRHFCRKCWQAVQSSGPPLRVPAFPPGPPNGALLAQRADDRIWITPAFFRFQEEAQRFLALPPYNRAERGLYLDYSRSASASIPWRVCAAVPYAGRPGGALEHQLVLSLQPWQPPLVVEAFETIPVGTTNQPAVGTSADFHFDAF